MTNIHLHQPTALSEKITEIFSIVVVVLTGALTLVTLAAS
jgi:hypothetical protein